MKKIVFAVLIFVLFIACERDNWKPEASSDTDSSVQIKDDHQELPDIEKNDLDEHPDPDNGEPDEVEDEDIVENEEQDDNEPVDYCDLDPVKFDFAVAVDDVYSSIEYDKTEFPMTVQAGSMESDRVILWNFAESGAEKLLVVWRESKEAGKVMKVRELDVTPVDGFMKVSVDGLAPGTWYSYSFLSRGETGFTGRSMIGKFKTAIHQECMEVITITGTHGTNIKHEYTALEVSAQFNADFFVQLGDYSYNDGCSSTGDFRAKWRKTLSETDYTKLLPYIGQYLVWDDHEVEDNADYEPDLKKDLVKVHRGLDVWFETNPVEQRADVENNWGNPSYYRSFKWGKTLELFMLDCRAERIPDSRSSNDPVYMSRKQMDWFKQALLDSDAHFKVVANSVPIAHYGGLWDFAINDRWEGYEAQRSEILNHIVNNDIKNVVWLSGDFHTGSVAPVDDPFTPWGQMWEINMGPGGNTNVLGDAGLILNFLWNTGKMNATVIVFDPFKNTIYAKFLDPDDKSVMFETTLQGHTAPLNPLGVYNY